MRRLWLIPAAAVLLAGCGGSPRAELRGDVEAVTRAANAADAQGVRDAVEDLLDTIRRQVNSRKLDRDEAERLQAIALQIRESSALLEEPEPTEQPEP
ncbi:MAG: hypothetical protein WD794_13915, partial [Mycobacteriales bacterium]